MLSKKTFVNALRALMVAGSIGGFLGGWAFLAHSGKPVNTNPLATGMTISTSTPALQPLDLKALAPAQGGVGTSVQPLQPAPSIRFSMPRLRTGGS